MNARERAANSIRVRAGQAALNDSFCTLRVN